MDDEQAPHNPGPVLNVHGGLISLEQGKEQLNRLYSSKHDLYKALTDLLVSHSERPLILIFCLQHVCLPPKGKCSLNFLHLILSGQKLAVRTTQVHPLKIPKIPELSVQRMWPLATRHPKIMGFLPDEWKGGPKTDRTFFFQIWVYLECAMVEEIISDVRKQRFLLLRYHVPRPIVSI